MGTYDKELLIQWIKRQDFKTIEEKEDIVKKFKDYVIKNNFIPLDAKIAGLTKELVNDEVKFKEIFLDPISWIYYSVFSNRYNLNKTWIWFKPDDMESNVIKFLNNKLDEIYKKIGINDEIAKAKVFSIYGYTSLEDIWEDIDKDFQNILVKYDLKDKKYPVQIGYTFEERKNIFESWQENLEKYIDDLVWSKKEEFKKDLIDFRLKMYLLSHFWRNHKSNLEQWLWSSRARSVFINSIDWKWAQNIFRLSRFITPEVTDIKLD